jgi:putative endonuclease
MALIADDWSILARRLRTPVGEIDIVAERDGLLAILEVKARPSLIEAAYAITERQRRRLLGAAAVMLATHPTWGQNGIRFDVIVVDATGKVRRIIDAFRQEQ